MPHAFRAAAHIEAENAQRKLERLRDRWLSAANTWFDGSAESVERRIANVDEVIALAKSIGSRLYQAKVGGDALALLPQLHADRSQLENMRDHITGASWFPGGDAEAGQFNIDPRMYPSQRDWMDASNLGGYIQDVQHQHPSHRQDPEADERLTHAALEFIAEQNTDDRQELLIRAQRLVEQRTSAWSPEGSQKAVRDFVAAVSAVTPRQVRQANRDVMAATVEDFDDVLMFS